MQATRGASLSPSDPGVGTAAASRRRTARWVVTVSAVTAYAADIGGKQWALANLEDRDIHVVGDLLVLHLTHNPGAAFSTGTQFTLALTCVAIVALCVVLWLSLRLGSALWALGFGLLLGGVGGNLTDRLVRAPGAMRGHVVDWLMLPNWPVFNIADMCIIGAAIVIVVQSLRGVTLSGERVQDE